jgi:pimeloyl-ACP methyl ester carboxylesterase
MINTTTKIAKTIALLLLPIVFLNSCNSYKTISKHICKKMSNGDLKYYELKTNEYTFSYWDNKSDKPVLILLHGFGATTEFQWYKQVKALNKKFRLVIPNLLYFGTSDATLKGYKISDQVEFVNKLIDTMGIQHFSICGISYGALVATELTDLYHYKVDKLIITDGPVKFFSENDFGQIYKKYKVQSISELLLPSNYKGLKKLLDVAYYKRPYVPNFVLKSMYNNLYNKDQYNQLQLLKHLDNERQNYITKEYKNINIPVLLVWGSDDNLIPRHVGDQLNLYFVGKSNLVVINNTAHTPNLEKPKAYTRIIEKFLRE